MKAVFLSAAPVWHASMGELSTLLRSELARAGYADVRSFDLTTAKLAFCQGEFDCWVKTPGRCRAEDTETEIVAAVHDADALVLLGPVTFGGHGYVLKRAIDRLLCLLEPFFTKRASLTHHTRRYDRYPSLFSVGWAPEPSLSVAETFDELNDANAINFFAPRRGALVADDANRERWCEAIRTMFDHPRAPGATLTSRESLRAALLSSAAPDPHGVGPVHTGRAAILVGSSKPKGTSASEALARALGERLERASVAAEYHFATEFVHDDARAAAQAKSIAACDLFVLATPLYVDSLPALATHALELVLRAREGAPPPGRFIAMVNCGFPEAEHNRTALRIARHFAEQARYAWAGGLALGGGGVVKRHRSLERPHAPVASIVRALDRAAPALARGDAIPIEAIASMAEAPIPEVLYRVIADLGFRFQAYQNRVSQHGLHAHPLDSR